MAFERREPANKKVGQLGTGLYLAKVISHLDPSYMGSLEVTLQRRQANALGDDNQTYVVRYASPFFGSTAFEFMGTNKEDFNDTQKTYGMWFVPPDVGQTVLVCFVDGSAAEGYWLACIPARFANNMVPGIASTTDVELSDADKKKYAPSTRLPVAEVNKRLNTDPNSINPDIVKKAVHPIAEHLLEAGLLDDDVRGTHNSSSRRDIPSMVFGISTPGPLDRRPGAKKAVIGSLLSKSETPVPVSRLGGTQMVFDDGDDQYQRKTPASEGPVEYADILNDEKGEPTIPYGECFRIRTRTGHQLLLHNSEDLIYISNSRGTTWIELTSNGKIDIYAKDSVSVHTENDLNFRADRDVNIEAGRNVNIKATSEYQDPETRHEEPALFDANGFESGRVRIESVQNFDLLIGRNGKIHVRNDEDIEGNLDIKVKGNMRVSVQDKDEEPTHTNLEDQDGVIRVIEDQPEEIKGLHIYSYENTRVLTKKNVDMITEENVKIKTKGNLDLNTDGNNAYTAGGTTDIKSGGNHTETAPQIHMNGPAARVAEIAEEAEIADRIEKLPVYDNPFVDNINQEWKDRYLSTDLVKSIMKRVPMHEPWLLHENQTPNTLTPDATDREAPDGE
jgi:uncharacterized protein (DUF2345 family)